jgi:hypothetical protein
MKWLLTFLKSWMLSAVMVLVVGLNLHVVDAVYAKDGLNGLTDLDLCLVAEVTIGGAQLADEFLESTRNF